MPSGKAGDIQRWRSISRGARAKAVLNAYGAALLLKYLHGIKNAVQRLFRNVFAALQTNQTRDAMQKHGHVHLWYHILIAVAAAAQLHCPTEDIRQA